MSTWLLPVLAAVLGVLFLLRGERCQRAFLRGAHAGLKSALTLFPTLLLFVCAVSMFRAGNVPDVLSRLLCGVCDALHIPDTLLPLLLVRPVSGSASTAVLSDLFAAFGTDSALGLCASVVCGSSETVLYVLSVLTAGTPLSETRHLLPAALLTSLFVTFLSLCISRLCFG